MKHQWSTVGNIQKPTTLSVKKSQDDALNRDHDAQDANVVRPSTGHGFHQGTNLNARADRRDSGLNPKTGGDAETKTSRGGMEVPMATPPTGT